MHGVGRTVQQNADRSYVVITNSVKFGKQDGYGEHHFKEHTFKGMFRDD